MLIYHSDDRPISKIFCVLISTNNSLIFKLFKIDQLRSSWTFVYLNAFRERERETLFKDEIVILNNSEQFWTHRQKKI